MLMLLRAVVDAWLPILLSQLVKRSGKYRPTDIAAIRTIKAVEKHVLIAPFTTWDSMG
jgi:hypothetical protein